MRMQDNALAVKGLTKRYGRFALENVSFSVPRGTVVGLVGENGAGKSTTLNAALGLIHADAGSVEILGEQTLDAALCEQIGVVFDANAFPNALTPEKLNRIFRRIYRTWEEERYRSLLREMGLPADRRIGKLSKGMKMKLAIAAALSHGAKLLILDEATSGLDPIAREEILDLLLDFVQAEDHAVLLSSHITSDLEKIADFIVFLHAGRVIFEKPKDELRYRYGIVRCGAAQFAAIDKADRIAWRKQDYEWEVLVADREAAQRKYPKSVVDLATIDEIMLLHIKGETK